MHIFLTAHVRVSVKVSKYRRHVLAQFFLCIGIQSFTSSLPNAEFHNILADKLVLVPLNCSAFCSMAAHSTARFFRHVAVPVSNFRNHAVSGALTTVPIWDRIMFHAFRVEPWHGFTKEAARFMVGNEQERELDPGSASLMLLNHG